MKSAILLLSLLYCTVGYGQRRDTAKVFYGIAGIKKEKIDSTKIFWKRYIKLRDAGVADSINPYKLKLKK